jgi:hypothetical protein
MTALAAGAAITPHGRDRVEQRRATGNAAIALLAERADRPANS